MTHRYTFDLKMFATVRLAGKDIAKARNKVEAAFDDVAIEAVLDGKRVRSSASRDGSADLLDSDRARSKGVSQMRYCFDLMFFGTLQVPAESEADARRILELADIKAIVTIDSERKRLDASVDGEPELLEIDGNESEADDELVLASVHAPCSR